MDEDEQTVLRRCLLEDWVRKGSFIILESVVLRGFRDSVFAFVFAFAFSFAFAFAFAFVLVVIFIFLYVVLVVAVIFSFAAVVAVLIRCIVIVIRIVDESSAFVCLLLSIVAVIPAAVRLTKAGGDSSDLLLAGKVGGLVARAVILNDILGKA